MNFNLSYFVFFLSFKFQFCRLFSYSLRVRLSLSVNEQRMKIMNIEHAMQTLTQLSRQFSIRSSLLRTFMFLLIVYTKVSHYVSPRFDQILLQPPNAFNILPSSVLLWYSWCSIFAKHVWNSSNECWLILWSDWWKIDDCTKLIE